MGGPTPTVPGEGHNTAAGAGVAALKSAAGPGPHELRLPTVDAAATQSGVSQSGDGVGAGPQVQSTDRGDVLCGPLINYRHMGGDVASGQTWHGSVLIVTVSGQEVPELSLRCLGRVATGETTGNADDHTTLPAVNGDSGSQSRSFTAQKLYEDPGKAFWRFVIDVPIQEFEAKWEYSIPRLRFGAETGTKKVFAVQSQTQSMRIMFHSCNGFSVGTDVDAWSGPALWNDVLRMYTDHPFHVMIGGGDQIYNDGVRVDGPLKPWTDIGNPRKRREFPFNETMRSQCDEYYFQNYIKWYGQEPFKSANGVIPQLNIWDDHDIIDGFGSYTDHFMRCPVFRGIGGVAHKYYLLFQHHLAPPKSTFTTDAPQTTQSSEGTTAADAVQLKDTWVYTNDEQDSSYIIGSKPGPYVEERSRSIYCQLGARIAFLGIDARTERTRHQINYPETYDQILNRADEEFTRANGAIKHLILLLGVPIAYPRLQWLENIFSSPIIGPIRFLNKRFGLGGGFFNHFDGQVDLLDDLDDHYTARHHKKERRELILRLQALAKKHSIRISILGGDVHLAAIGRFYSNPKLNIPAERDWRYMPNIISSAITNKPPPAAVANLLARRNKIHHLDHDTDETLLQIFDRDPGIKNKEDAKEVGKKSGDANHATMPSRNYAIISESKLHHQAGANGVNTNGINGTAAHEPAINGTAVNGTAVNGTTPNGTTSDSEVSPHPAATQGKKFNMRHPFHKGEEGAGTNHPAATGLTRTGLAGDYGLDVTLRVEISNKDREGKTEGYGFSIPGLECKAYVDEGTKW